MFDEQLQQLRLSLLRILRFGEDRASFFGQQLVAFGDLLGIKRVDLHPFGEIQREKPRVAGRARVGERGEVGIRRHGRSSGCRKASFNKA